MKMEYQDLPDGVTRVTLDGDLDARGAGEIDLQFQAIVASRSKVVVDLSQVGFLASIGIRTLIQGAKANAGKGGRLVLMNPSEAVWKVIVTCGADAVLPMAHGQDAAFAALV
jgi:anti-anti-sigma factor